MACDASIPKYSLKLRETFHSINPYHVSCTYKELFDDHALDILRSLSDVEDASNACLIDPPSGCLAQKRNSNSASRCRCKPTCGDRSDTAVPPIAHYNPICGDEPLSENHGICYKPECQMLLSTFFKTAALQTSNDNLTLKDQLMSPWQMCSLSDTDKCEFGHDSSKTSPRHSNAGHSQGRTPAIQNPLPFSSPRLSDTLKGKKPVTQSKSFDTKMKQTDDLAKHFKSRMGDDSSVKSSRTRSNEDGTITKLNKPRSAPDYFKKDDISYPFSHGEVQHAGHMWHYRENVTRANLETGLSRVAQIYQQMGKNRSRLEHGIANGNMMTGNMMMTADFNAPSLRKSSKLYVGIVKGHVGYTLADIIHQHMLNVIAYVVGKQIEPPQTPTSNTSSTSTLEGLENKSRTSTTATNTELARASPVSTVNVSFSYYSFKKNAHNKTKGSESETSHTHSGCIPGKKRRPITRSSASSS